MLWITLPSNLCSVRWLKQCLLHKPTVSQVDSKRRPADECRWLQLTPVGTQLERDALGASAGRQRPGTMLALQGQGRDESFKMNEEADLRSASS